MAEPRRPSGVLDGLGHGFAKGLIALQFNDNQVSRLIDPQQIENRALSGPNLASDNENVISDDRDVLIDPVLEMPFECDGARRERLRRPAISHSPRKCALHATTSRWDYQKSDA